MRTFGTFLWALFLGLHLQGQQGQIIRFPEYKQYVIEHHPVLKQASLLSDQATAYLQKARGSFDPKIYGDLQQKTFVGKRYYTLGEAGVKWPVWMGMTLKSNYLWSNGIYLNPENTLPAAGQWNVGLELEVLQGLLIDERRTMLRQARVLVEANANEQLIILNQLLQQAGESYWEWVYAYQARAVFAATLDNTEQRFTLLKDRFLQGDLPALDTLEAWIQVQTRRNDLLQSQFALQEAQINLAAFLWQDDKIALELARQLVPADEEVSIPSELLLEDNTIQVQWVTNHPEYQQYDYKSELLELDRRWAKEQLKPSLQVSYQVLGDGFNLAPAIPDQDLLLNNAKWGVRLGFPVLLRKERANLKLVEQKLQSVEWDRQQKEGALIQKIQAYRQKALTRYEQWQQQERMAMNSQQLLDGEMEKFRLGSSSILVINLREQKLIDAQIKAQKLKSELGKALVGWQAATLLWQ